MVAIGIANIPVFARLTRGSSPAGPVERLRARGAAAGTAAAAAISCGHVLPNIAPVLIVQATVLFAVAILAEAALSYLGLGTPPPTPSWGRMLQREPDVLRTTTRRWRCGPASPSPSPCSGFNLLGDGLRDALDPRLRAVRA